MAQVTPHKANKATSERINNMARGVVCIPRARQSVLARANRRMLASSAPADHAGPSTLSNTDSNGEYIAGAKMNAFFEVHFVYLIPFF